MRVSRRGRGWGILVPILVVSALVISTTGASTAQSSSAESSSFSALLAELGIGPLPSLGAEADWLGHPSPESVPFLLPHVESIHRDPRRLVVLGQNLHHATQASTKQSAANGFLTLATVFALQPRHAGFRGVLPPTESVDEEAWEDIAASLGIPTTVPEWPEELRRPLLALLAEISGAVQDVESSWRHVSPETLAQAFAYSDVPRRLPGGTVPWPALYDAARLGDDTSRAHAFLRLGRAMFQAAASLEGLEVDFDRVEFKTRYGRLILAGSSNHVHRCANDCLLILDLGGDDTYRGSAAGAEGAKLSLVLDLSGDDLYDADRAKFAQGSGRGGLGMLLDLAGSDRYLAEDHAQGFGLLGYGLLYDGGGKDLYRASGGAQGSALFGAGLLIDRDGNDRYAIHGEGQGFGGPSGCGALIDQAGNDHYHAEPDPLIAIGRADYHSDGEVAASNAQGAGVGRRGDLTDGHLWAGGVGVLSDLSGDDSYQAGNFSQGSGYAYGTGMLLDTAGQDLYRSVYFAQASASHSGLALLSDLSGDDRYFLERQGGAGLGYGWDFALGIFWEGGGNDHYQAVDTALGVAQRSSLGWFLDLAGDDAYDLPAESRAFGRSLRSPVQEFPGGGPLRAAHLAELLGLFLDLGGQDTYPDEALASDGGRWRGKECRARESNAKSCGLGVDLESVRTADSVGWLVEEIE